MTGWLARWGLAWLALTVLQVLAGGLLLSSTPGPTGAGLGWLALSNALVALIAVALGGQMSSTGRPRVLAMFAVLCGVRANNLVEAAFFALDIPSAVLPRIFAADIVVTLAFAWVIDRLCGPGAGAADSWPSGRDARSWAVRIVACDLGYVLTYLGAGLLVWPFVRSFYAGRAIPGLAAVLLMQTLRGLLFIGILALMVRRLGGRRATVALLAGLTLSILGGVAPLVFPNPYMPDSVRWPHLLEIGISNLLFGWLAALVLSRRDPPVERVIERIRERKATAGTRLSPEEILTYRDADRR